MIFWNHTRAIQKLTSNWLVKENKNWEKYLIIYNSYMHIYTTVPHYHYPNTCSSYTVVPALSVPHWKWSKQTFILLTQLHPCLDSVQKCTDLDSAVDMSCAPSSANPICVLPWSASPSSIQSLPCITLVPITPPPSKVAHHLIVIQPPSKLDCSGSSCSDHSNGWTILIPSFNQSRTSSSDTTQEFKAKP